MAKLSSKKKEKGTVLASFGSESFGKEVRSSLPTKGSGGSATDGAVNSKQNKVYKPSKFARNQSATTFGGGKDTVGQTAAEKRAGFSVSAFKGGGAQPSRPSFAKTFGEAPSVAKKAPTKKKRTTSSDVPRTPTGAPKELPIKKTIIEAKKRRSAHSKRSDEASGSPPVPTLEPIFFSPETSKFVKEQQTKLKKKNKGKRVSFSMGAL